MSKYLDIARGCWDSVKNIHYLPPAVYGMKVAYEKEIKNMQEQNEEKEEKKKMITKITPETTVTEICEVIKYIEKKEKTEICSMILFHDMSGRFVNTCDSDDTIVEIEELEEYLTKQNDEENEENIRQIIKRLFDDPKSIEMIMDIVRKL